MSSGVALVALSIPIDASLSTIAACCMILTNSAWMRATTGAGVPAGATMPCHWLVAKPAKPDSARVGTLGKTAERIAPVTAIAFSLPLLMCGKAGAIPSSPNLT